MKILKLVVKSTGFEQNQRMGNKDYDTFFVSKEQKHKRRDVVGYCTTTVR